MNKKKILIILVFCMIMWALPEWSASAQSDPRPVVTVSTYAANKTPARGEDFSLTVQFHNSGRAPAYDMFIEFLPGELIPINNGGIQTIYQLVMDETKGIRQDLKVSPDLWGATVASVTVNVNYSDDVGNSYSDTFSIAVNLSGPKYSAPTPTPTPTQIMQPQLVIDAYETDVEVLQPGTAFELSLDITNLGNAGARAVSMVLGGGSVEVNPEGTPQPGISGGEGEFATFAPLDSSNVKYIGDLDPGERITASQRIIVNVSTAPGAYSLKYSFIYMTESGERVVDNQVITLLVYRMPTIEVGFYQDPGTIFANQTNFLPLQIMNLGKQSVVLGNMLVAANDAVLENNTALVGPVEAGFYFTLDTMVIPNSSGPLDLLISVNYTDDFNQPRVYETTLTLDVIEMDQGPGGNGMPMEGEEGMGDWMPPAEDGFPSGGTETFWQKIVRFFKGLFGLDSGKPEQQDYFEPSEFPMEEMMPVESGGSGKGR